MQSSPMVSISSGTWPEQPYSVASLKVSWPACPCDWSLFNADSRSLIAMRLR